MWLQIQATERHHLPDAGGLLDQNETLMLDISTIGWQSQVVEAEIKRQTKSPDGDPPVELPS